MGKTVEAKFRDDLRKYKLLCSIIINIFALEEQKDNEYITINGRYLTSNLLSNLEEFQRLNKNDMVIIPPEGTLGLYENMVYQMDRSIYNKYNAKLGSGYVAENLKKINYDFHRCLEASHNIIKHDTKIDLYQLLKNDENVFLRFIFSPIEFQIRKDLFIKNLLDKNGYNYSSYSKVLDAFKKNDIKIKDEDFEYGKKYCYYIEYISKITIFPEKIIGVHSYSKDICLELMKSGLEVDYYDALIAIHKNYFNPELLNEIIKCYRFYGKHNYPNNLNLKNKYGRYIGNFEEDINNLVVLHISDFNEALKVDFKFADLPQKILSDKLFCAIKKQMKYEVKLLLDRNASDDEVEAYINKIYLKIVSKATTKKETERYINIASWVVEYTYWYIEDYKKNKADAARLILETN